jgi:hypothetical protein
VLRSCSGCDAEYTQPGENKSGFSRMQRDLILSIAIVSIKCGSRVDILTLILFECMHASVLGGIDNDSCRNCETKSDGCSRSETNSGTNHSRVSSLGSSIHTAFRNNPNDHRTHIEQKSCNNSITGGYILSYVWMFHESFAQCIVDCTNHNKKKPKLPESLAT